MLVAHFSLWLNIYIKIDTIFSLSVDGHWVSFFAYYKNAAVNICIQVVAWNMFSFLLSRHLGIELLGYMENSC